MFTVVESFLTSHALLLSSAQTSQRCLKICHRNNLHQCGRITRSRQASIQGQGRRYWWTKHHRTSSSLIQALPLSQGDLAPRSMRCRFVDLQRELFGRVNSPTSLRSITAYQDAEECLLLRWKRILTLPMYVQDYATVASDLQRAAKNLIEFIELKWNSGVLWTHGPAGTIQTPSRRQVHEPIHKKSIGRWEDYLKLFNQLPKDIPCWLTKFSSSVKFQEKLLTRL